MSASKESVIPDEFNFELVSFQVENRVFRILKHSINVPGTFFETIHTLSSSSKEGPGSSNENPIHLCDITEKDFRSFLCSLLQWEPAYDDVRELDKRLQQEFWPKTILISGTIVEDSAPSQSSTNANSRSSNTNPIHLSGIKESRFRSFLCAVYSTDKQPSMLYEDWIGVLRLSTLWKFRKIRANTISALSSSIIYKGWAKRIQVAEEFNVTKWLRNAYIDLVLKEPLDYDELTSGEFRLDWDTVAMIFFIRDKVTSFGRRDLESVPWSTVKALVNEHMLKNI